MQRTQRIIELRQMFLDLSTIFLEEIKKGKTLSELQEIKEVLESIANELRKLESERKEENPIKRNSA